MPTIRTSWLLVPLTLLVLCVFWPGVHGGFILDDYPNLLDDPAWRLTSFDLHSLFRALGTGFSGLGGRPLAMLSFGLNFLSDGMSPYAMKATNVAWHALNSVLVFWFCRLLFGRVVHRPREAMGAFAAVVCAAAWALHPTQVSTVLYVVQRMEIGATSCVLLALIAYLMARDPANSSLVRLASAIGVALSTVVGLGFKESALLVPAYALVIELAILRFEADSPRASTQLRTAYVAAVGIALAAFVFVVVPRYAAVGAYAGREFTVGQRVLSQGPILLMYLKQMMLPLPDSQLFYYDHLHAPLSLMSSPRTLIAWLALIALLVVAWGARNRFRLVTFGILWYFVAHALTSNVVPLELAFEHRNYLALLGPVVAAAQLLSALAQRFHLDARRTAACALLAPLIFMTALEARTWSDPFRLAVALASRNPASSRASYDLGRLLLERSGNDPQGANWQFSTKEFEHASRVQSISPLPEQALIIMYSRIGQPPPAGTWDRLRAKYNRPMTAESEGALWQLMTCRQQGLCKLDDVQLLSVFGTALEANPKSARLHSLYATFAYTVMGDRPLGIRMMRDAISLAPGDPQFKANLARLLLTAGVDDAEVAALVGTVRASNWSGTYDEDLAAIQALRATLARRRGESRE